VVGAVVVIGGVVPEGATAIVDGGGNDAATSCLWMLTKTNDTIMHPTKDYNMKWCKLCGPGRTKGTPTGMYMQAPHDHAKWLSTKKGEASKV
jgi:hypothetical protein